MPNVSIVTDSVASLPMELFKKLDIRWVPYYIHRGREVLRDLVTIQRDAFYDWLASAEQVPKTANPSPGDYAEVYAQLALEGVREIVSIHITSKGSGAYQAALAAKEIALSRFPDLHIEIIDTLNVSMCQGWMVIEAARAALAGASLDSIVARVREMIPVTQMMQTADTLKYLAMGGRIGKAGHLIGSLLKIKPIISMQDGEIVALGLARTRQRVYRTMVKKLEQIVGQGGKIKIAYVHAAALEEVEKLRALVEERLQPVESLVTELSPALGVHTGPGTVGFCFYPVPD
jgi:DegV family protein with EDD domain